MRRGRVRATIAFLAALTGCLAVAPAPVFAAGPPLTLSTIALGNIFTDGQQVKVGLSTSAPSVSWSVTSTAPP
jgi:hypothetical protein